GEIPRAAHELGVYLRADPACSDLAASCPWSEGALQIAIDLHVAGHVPAREVMDMVLRAPPTDVRTFILAERHRAPHAVDAYLAHAALHGPGPAPSYDILDTLFAALATAAGEDPAFPIARARDRFVDIVTPRKQRVLARRAAVALLALRAGTSMANPV